MHELKCRFSFVKMKAPGYIPVSKYTRGQNFNSNCNEEIKLEPHMNLYHLPGKRFLTYVKFWSPRIWNQKHQWTFVGTNWILTPQCCIILNIIIFPFFAFGLKLKKKKKIQLLPILSCRIQGLVSTYLVVWICEN